MSASYSPDSKPTERSPHRSSVSGGTGSSTRPPISLPEGTTLRDEYKIGAVLGTGSFGITYRARDVHLDTTVAIKEYYPRHMAGRTDASKNVQPYTDENIDEFSFGLEQFRREGRTLARFDHPNIVDVRSYFEENGTGYIVMDYYEGQTLSDYLKKNGGTIPEDDALAIMQDVLDGLRPVHKDGLLHRDIDPQNIYLTEEGRAVLIDFGAAREAMGTRTQSLSVILKPGYAPFEQYSTDGNQGPHTDLYACAATLYKCLTGLKPPDATDRLQDDKLVSPREVKPTVSVETSVAVMKSLRLNPNKRPASVEEFSGLLKDDTKAHERVDDVSSASMTSPPSEASLTSSATRQIDAPAPAAATPDESSTNTGLISGVGLFVGILGTIGGTLLFSETSPAEVLSFFVTWIALCTGLVWMFREGEKVMSGESRAAVSDWLLQEDFASRRSNWPETFVSLFDALFTENHLSWTCFFRSALTSIAVITILFGVFIGFGVIPFPPLDKLLLIGLALLLPVSMNIVVDYASLFETRWILGRMSNSSHPLVHVGYLGIDLLLTFLCILTPFFAIQFVGISLIAGHPLGSMIFWKQLLGAIQNAIELFFLFGTEDFGGLPDVMSIMLFSTMFTSVWVWLYVGAGLLLQTLRPVFESLDVLKRHLNVETRPIHTMGMLLAVLTSLGFVVSAPFVL